MKLNNTTLAAIVFMIIGAASRFISTIPNFSAIEALALMGGAYIATRAVAFIVPILTLYLSDLVINNTVSRPFFDQEGFVWWSDYMTWNFLSMILITLMGIFLLKKISMPKVLGGSLLGSIIFFLVSNFGVWLGSTTYPQNFTGLIECYTAGIPFFRNSAISAVAFSAILFGSFELYKRFFVSKMELEKVKH